MNSAVPAPELISRIPNWTRVLSDGPGFGERLTRWLAEARSDEAIGARRREGWLRQQIEEETNWAGVLVDVCERRVAVVVSLTTGRRHAGTIVGVGADLVVLALPAGRHVLLPDRWLQSLVVDDARPPAGHRVERSDLTLLTALTELSAERARVALSTVSAEVVTGTLEAVGADVVRVRVDGSNTSAYVRLALVSEVTEV